ncbi:Chromate reductase [Pontiella desulfatans]|uniref:Chromate reductase n=1 Tax=Pontiella desulfatans TaxID=2750659 RepID=A0A6C2UB09_PONDE|nr:NAD(P)H-dependent oxidoreductase [Pontiella desulfatans]VGO17342.1 Chromate reductase [Pontiella desulfatans]
MKNILAFAGSNSSRSVNKQLLEHAEQRFKDQKITLINLPDFDAPIFSEDLEKEFGIPESIQKLREQFDSHDAYLIASPEHNGMMPAFFKNVMDWLSRMDGSVFQKKPVMLMSASPGPRGGQTNLANMKAVFPHWGASAVFADFFVGSFHQTYDAGEKAFTNPDDEQRLLSAILDYEAHLANE